jgi:hypothetical protein
MPDWKVYAKNAIVELQRAETSDAADVIFFLKQALAELQTALESALKEKA